MAGTCDLSLFQVNIRAALAAICRLHSFRFPLEVVAVGAPNLDPRFCSHSELLNLQYHPRDSFPLLEMVCLRRISLLERIIGWRARRVESNCLKETARGASLFCVVTRKVTYNINGSTARGWSSVGFKFEHSGREGLRCGPGKNGFTQAGRTRPQRQEDAIAPDSPRPESHDLRLLSTPAEFSEQRRCSKD